jgi:tRNA A37 N6-isopentenylltransferase MiaA
VEEVRGLVERHGLEAVRGFPGIGYGEIGEMLASCALRAPGQQGARATQEKVKSDILVATRQYAKRQLTWFRREPTLREVMLSGSQLFPADESLLP